MWRSCVCVCEYVWKNLERICITQTIEMKRPFILLLFLQGPHSYTAHIHTHIHSHAFTYPLSFIHFKLLFHSARMWCHIFSSVTATPTHKTTKDTLPSFMLCDANGAHGHTHSHAHMHTHRHTYIDTNHMRRDKKYSQLFGSR